MAHSPLSLWPQPLVGTTPSDPPSSKWQSPTASTWTTQTASVWVPMTPPHAHAPLSCALTPHTLTHFTIPSNTPGHTSYSTALSLPHTTSPIYTPYIPSFSPRNTAPLCVCSS